MRPCSNIRPARTEQTATLLHAAAMSPATHPFSEQCVSLEGHFYTASRSSLADSASALEDSTRSGPPFRLPAVCWSFPRRKHGTFSRDVALKVTGASSEQLPDRSLE